MCPSFALDFTLRRYTKEVAMPRWWAKVVPERFRAVYVPLLDDSKLLAATLAGAYTHSLFGST
jgi:hypothetical protein